MRTLYSYSWGDEELLGNRITITQDEVFHEIYRIMFQQETFNTQSFQTICVNAEEILRQTTRDADFGMVGLYRQTVYILLRAKCNPKPEDLFKIH